MEQDRGQSTDAIRSEVREFYAVWREMNFVYNKWAKGHDLSFYQLYALYAIWEGEGACTQKDICCQWMLPKQTVNSILKHYEAEGLIRFQVCESDKRNKAICLTGEGQAYADRILGELTALENAVFEAMGGSRGRALIENSRAFAELFGHLMEGK